MAIVQYLRGNGVITRISHNSAQDPEALVDALHDVVLVDGVPDSEMVYVKGGQLLPYPDKPGRQYVWSGAVWVVDSRMAERLALAKRDALFAATIDRLNPFWLASMAPEQQAECEQFRQALLDITDQPGYPNNIDWPPVPSILTTSAEETA